MFIVVAFRGYHLVARNYPKLLYKPVIAKVVNGKWEIYTYMDLVINSEGKVCNALDMLALPVVGLINELYGQIISELLACQQVVDYVLNVSDKTVIDCSKLRPSNIHYVGIGEPLVELPVCFDSKDPRWAAKVTLDLSDALIASDKSSAAKILIVTGGKLSADYIIDRILSYYTVDGVTNMGKIEIMYVITKNAPIRELACKFLMDERFAEVRYLAYMAEGNIYYFSLNEGMDSKVRVDSLRSLMELI